MLGRDLTSFRLRQRGVRQCWTERKTIKKSCPWTEEDKQANAHTMHMTRKMLFHFPKRKEKRRNVREREREKKNEYTLDSMVGLQESLILQG